MTKILFFLFIISSYASAQDTLIFKSALTPADDTTLVFIPAEKKFDQSPLVILLHGWSGNYAQWSGIIDLQEFSDQYGFVIACPDGFYDSWYVNSPMNPRSSMESFILNELIPRLIEKYQADSSNIFISGLSMGGYGALQLFFKYPERFRSAGSTSGILDITKFPDKWGMKEVFGDIEIYPYIWEAYSVQLFAEKMQSFDKDFIFDCGTEDFAYGVNEEFYALCMEKGLKAKFISQPGNHSRNYWEKSIKDHLLFFSGLVNDSH